jgi:CheY-like chemotaxis protein
MAYTSVKLGTSGDTQVETPPTKGLDSEQPKILVVDDHPSSRMTAVALLSIEGYDVLEADSGSSALDCVLESNPDLILLDVMMPGMDGYEVCRRLKQDEQTRLIPVVFVTALNDRRARLRGAICTSAIACSPKTAKRRFRPCWTSSIFNCPCCRKP